MKRAFLPQRRDLRRCRSYRPLGAYAAMHQCRRAAPPTESSSKPLWVTIGGALAFVLFMLALVKRALPRFEAKAKRWVRL